MKKMNLSILRASITSQLFLVVTILLARSGGAVELPVTFVLNTAPDTVALQFDVTPSNPGAKLEAPKIESASPHQVQSAVLASGATRFVIYSTVGQQIGSNGQVTVDFSSSDLADGSLSISGVVTSDGDGELTAAAPNSLPIVVPETKEYRSQQVGVPLRLAARAYDLDGQITSMEFRENGIPFATSSSFLPGQVSWPSQVVGTQNFSVAAVDEFGGTSVVDLGVVRTYQISEIGSFSDFEEVHFGTITDPANRGFHTKSFGNDFTNGLAWMLGVNPHSPDLTRFPTASVEGNAGSAEFVLRFNRVGSIPRDRWWLMESPDLTAPSWTEVPAAQISETPQPDGTVDVELRKLAPSLSNPKSFFSLNVNETP